MRSTGTWSTWVTSTSKGLTGAEQQERLTAVLSAESDRIVEAVLSSYMPLLGEFAQVGEGYLETLTRMATGSETAQAALRRLGVSVVELSALTNRQADDIGAELVRQSLLAAETTTTTTTRAMTEEERAAIEAINRAMGRVMLRIGDTVSTTVEELSGIGEIISGMDGGAQELADAYQALTDIRESLNLLGLSGAAVSRSLLQGAGSVERLQQGLADFEQVAYSDSERTAIAAQRLRADFGRLGLEMPASAAGLRALVAGIDASTESGAGAAGRCAHAERGLWRAARQHAGHDRRHRRRNPAHPGPAPGGGADSGLAQLQADFAVLTAQARAGDQGPSPACRRSVRPCWTPRRTRPAARWSWPACRPAPRPACRTRLPCWVAAAVVRPPWPTCWPAMPARWI